MGEQIRIGGLVISADVLETIVRLAAEKVDGVACVGMPGDLSSFITSFSAKKTLQTPAVGVRDENGQLRIAVHVTALFGYPFKTLAESVRASIAADMASQVGFDVSGVDVFIDALVFPKE